MKRYAVALAIASAILFSGCSAISGNAKSSASPSAAADTPSPVPAATAEPTPSPEPTEPEPVITVPATGTYTSAALELSFTVPANWVGKYRVMEHDDFLTVFFLPSAAYDLKMEYGELFTVAKETMKDAGVFYGGDWEFELNGALYAWGSISGFDYGESDPGYEMYVAMYQEVAAVFKTVRSLSGEAPKNVTRLWIETIPEKTEYKTSMGLGIKFTLPENWIGKCRIEEDEYSVSFYFKPKKPNIEYGDCFIFLIEKKLSDMDASGYDGVREFQVNGVTYFSGTIAGEGYQGPEQETYDAMFRGIQAIVDSVRAAD